MAPEGGRTLAQAAGGAEAGVRPSTGRTVPACKVLHERSRLTRGQTPGILVEEVKRPPDCMVAGGPGDALLPVIVFLVIR